MDAGTVSRVVSALYTAVGRKVANSSFHTGHRATYTVSTHVTLLIIKDRPGMPPAMLVKELPLFFFFLSLY